MNFSTLPYSLQIFQAIAATAVMIAFIDGFIRSVALKRHLTSALSLAGIAAGYAIMQLTIESLHGQQQNKLAVNFYNSVPNFIWVMTIAALAVFATVMIVALYIFHRASLSAMSVKEASDDLPVGMCYYYGDGRLLLCNRRMNEIGNTLLGATVMNGAELWKRISPNGKSEAVLETDGRTLHFREKTIRLKKDTIFEILSTDVTEEYALNRKLKNNNEKLEKQRLRLSELSELITATTIQKETLNAKITIHDELGTALVATKRFITDKSAYDERTLKELWHKNIALIKNENDSEPGENYSVVLKAAEDVGIDIEFDGTLPTEDAVKSVVICAINECITNTLRHARGDKMNIKIAESNGKLTVVFTNNGERPKGEIKETGGLKNLRSMAEKLGGEMTVKSEPKFELALVFNF